MYKINTSMGDYECSDEELVGCVKLLEDSGRKINSMEHITRGGESNGRVHSDE